LLLVAGLVAPDGGRVVKHAAIGMPGAIAETAARARLFGEGCQKSLSYTAVKCHNHIG
jgi:hypothetical protein